MELEQVETKDLLETYKTIKDFLSYLDKEIKTYKDYKEDAK